MPKKTISQIDQTHLLTLVAGGAVRRLVLRQNANSKYGVEVTVGDIGSEPLKCVLVTARNTVRCFTKLDTAAGFLKDLGVKNFEIELNTSADKEQRGIRF